MLVRPGTCTQCGATYHLPSDFAAPFVTCRLCPGAVRVDAAIEVPDPEPVAEATEPDATEASAHDETLEEAAAHLAYDTVQEAHDLVEELGEDIDEAVEAAEHASTEAFGMDAKHGDAHNELLHEIEELEHDIEELEAELHEEELEVEALEEEPRAEDDTAQDDTAQDDTAQETGPAPMPTRDVSGWSPAALEKGAAPEKASDLEEVRPSRSSGGTLARLKAERAAAADASEEKPMSTLERLKAERAADRDASPAEPSSTLERLKAERAAERARTETPTAVEAKPVSTLERLKAERAAERPGDDTRDDDAPSRASRRSARSAKSGRAARSRRGRDDDEGGRSHRPLRSREERKKQQLVLSLVSFGVLIVAGGLFWYGATAGWFDPAPTPEPESTATESEAPRPSPSSTFDPFAGVEIGGDEEEGADGAESGEIGTEGDTADDPGDDADGDADGTTGTSIEDQHRAGTEDDA